jgi:hypothetical protein
VPVPAGIERKSHASSLQSYSKRKKSSCSCSISLFKPTHCPQGGTNTMLAEGQEYYTNIHTNETLSNGTNIKNRKEVPSITLIAYSQVKHIYLSN